MDFSESIKQGIPNELPDFKEIDDSISHAPNRPNVLSDKEHELAISNSLRYFPKKWHKVLAKEFNDELNEFGHIYMYRFRPNYEMHARPINSYPAENISSASIMLMIQNNLDPLVAQYPHELITYGGNGSVFQNWAQYLIVMKYLSQMNENQTLVIYSGHPLGLFPSSKDSLSLIHI